MVVLLPAGEHGTNSAWTVGPRQELAKLQQKVGTRSTARDWISLESTESRLEVSWEKFTFTGISCAAHYASVCRGCPSVCPETSTVCLCAVCI